MQMNSPVGQMGARPVQLPWRILQMNSPVGQMGARPVQLPWRITHLLGQMGARLSYITR